MPTRPPALPDRRPGVVAGLPYPFARSQFDGVEPAFALTPDGPVGSTDAWSGRRLARLERNRWVPVTSGSGWHRAPRWAGTRLAYRVFDGSADETGRDEGPAAELVDPDPARHPALHGLPVPEGRLDTVRMNPEAPCRVAVLVWRGRVSRALAYDGAGDPAVLDAVVALGPWLGSEEIVVLRERWPARLPYRWHVGTGALRPLLTGDLAEQAVVADVQCRAGLLGFSWTASGQPRRIELAELAEIRAGAGVRLRRDSASGPVPAPARPVLVAGPRCRLPCLLHEPDRQPRGTVVLLHGGPNGAHRATWSPFAESLVLAGWRVVLPNVRGSGLLDPALRPPAPSRYGGDDVEDVAAVVARLGTGPVVLGGPSYGGYLAARAAGDLPGVRAVFLLGGFLAVTDLDGADRNGSGHPAVRAFLRAARDRFVPDRPPAPVPHFVAHGADDPRIPADAVTAHASQLVDASQVHVMPGEGHGIQSDAAARQTFPALLTWLDSR